MSCSVDIRLEPPPHAQGAALGATVSAQGEGLPPGAGEGWDEGQVRAACGQAPPPTLVMGCDQPQRSPRRQARQGDRGCTAGGGCSGGAAALAPGGTAPRSAPGGRLGTCRSLITTRETRP